MLDPSAIPPLDTEEPLTRFVLFSGHVRTSDNSLKADAFMPHPRVELSLTRHREATDAELWREGRRVAESRQRRLYGRAVVSAQAFTAEGLGVVAKPILPDNPNHADAIHWPSEKAAQKMKAIQIANRATYIPKST